MMELQQLQAHNVSQEDSPPEIRWQGRGVTCKCLPLSKSIKIVYNTLLPVCLVGWERQTQLQHFLCCRTVFRKMQHGPMSFLMMHAHSDTKRPEVLCF